MQFQTSSGLINELITELKRMFAWVQVLMTELFFYVKREYIVPTNSMYDWCSKGVQFFEMEEIYRPNKVEGRT